MNGLYELFVVGWKLEVHIKSTNDSDENSRLKNEKYPYKKSNNHIKLEFFNSTEILSKTEFRKLQKSTVPQDSII